MAVSERIWLIVFTVSEGFLPFLCYFFPKVFSYEVMMLLLPVGAAFLYLLVFGVKRLFETDVAEYGVFQIYVAAAVGFFFLVGFRFAMNSFHIENPIIYIFLFIGSAITIAIDDVIFAIIFIVIGKIYGLESIFSKKKKEDRKYFDRNTGPYGGFRNIYEQMYYEELEKRQRKQFKQRRNAREDVQWDQWHEFERQYREMPKEPPPPEFLFEKTVYFRSISSLEEVRPRYLQLMKKYHPDMPGGSKDIAQEIQSEYDKICEENGL